MVLAGIVLVYFASQRLQYETHNGLQLDLYCSRGDTVCAVTVGSPSRIWGLTECSIASGAQAPASLAMDTVYCDDRTHRI